MYLTLTFTTEHAEHEIKVNYLFGLALFSFSQDWPQNHYTAKGDFEMLVSLAESPECQTL